ncbi:sensor histidine kinase [Cohnella lupini]|uniref:histidine kinase n=1 Tax=Cohnella lupini TaxID=1294267 RepID=A0A3D9IJ90_9BACL|nr:HAMP domain-containing sensor histidine kinase [Cohnella lupini]RED61812.1 two-component system sensor histidine kinase VanS [Cohnella lupini]
MNVKSIISRLRNTITFKMFGLTVAILLVFSISTYLIIYTLLPHTYKSYKQQQLANNIDSFIVKSATLSDVEAEDALTELRLQTNIFITIKDKDEKLLYPVLGNVQLTPAVATAISLSPTPILTPSPGTTVSTAAASVSVASVSRDLVFKGKEASLIAYFTPQPIDEASKVLALLAPYVAAFILIASIGGSFFYSTLMTKPIRKITLSAGKMAELQLDTRIPVHSSDEIGKLANSLNVMAANLQGSIHELKTANEQLLKEMERERQVEARRRELFAAVSHELKSPLTVMKGQLEGMLYKIGIYADRETYLDKTLEVANEMETLIADMLRVASSDERQLSGTQENVSIRSLIQGLIAKYEELGQQRDLSLISLISDESEIRVHREMLEKALNNLMHNAIMYTNPGESVLIRQAVHADYLTIEIINTGAHIDERQIGRVFEPFYRIDNSRNRNTGGSGLGLYITKQILQQLSISIQAKNAKEGVVFSLHFLRDPFQSACRR